MKHMIAELIQKAARKIKAMPGKIKWRLVTAMIGKTSVLANVELDGRWIVKVDGNHELVCVGVVFKLAPDCHPDDEDLCFVRAPVSNDAWFAERMRRR